MFTGAYTVSQSPLTPSKITLKDTSSYADEGQGTFSTRRITVKLADGTKLVPDGVLTDYIDWPFTEGNEIELIILDRDYAPLITVQWLSTAPVTDSVYVKAAVYFFKELSENFYYHLTQLEAANQNITKDTTFMRYKYDLRTHIDSGWYAVNRDGDIFSGQAALNRAYNLISNQLSKY